MEVGCAYRFSTLDRKLPGDVERVSVPLFQNKTHEAGIEVPLTNAMVRELERSRAVKVVPREQAQAELIGEIMNVVYESTGTSKSRALPEGSSLSVGYRVYLTVKLRLRDTRTGKNIWSGQFLGERSYKAPSLTIEGLNSSNALYNQSIRQQTIEALSKDLMLQAHTQLTENF
jgi:TolB-like protein